MCLFLLNLVAVKIKIDVFFKVSFKYHFHLNEWLIECRWSPWDQIEHIFGKVSSCTPVPCLNMKTAFLTYGYSHYNDSTVIVFYKGNSHTDKTTSLYWDGHWLCKIRAESIEFIKVGPTNLLSGEPDYFGRNKISSGGDLSHYSSASLY